VRATTRKMLETLASDDPAIRFCAAHALGWSRSRHAVPALIRATTDPSPDVRMIAAHGLGRARGEGERVLDALVRLTKDDVESTRWAAVHAIRDRREPGALPVLLSLLTDPAPDLRDAAAGALRWARDPDAVAPSLERAAEADPDQFVRFRAAESLMSLGYQSGTQLMLALRTLPSLDPDVARMIEEDLAGVKNWPRRRRPAAR
jgi:HEAT repeat protein